MTALLFGVYLCAFFLFWILLFVSHAVDHLKDIAASLERSANKPPQANPVIRVRDEGTYDWRYPYGSSR